MILKCFFERDSTYLVYISYRIYYLKKLTTSHQFLKVRGRNLLLVTSKYKCKFFAFCIIEEVLLIKKFVTLGRIIYSFRIFCIEVD